MTRRNGGSHLLGDMVARATRPALKKRGFAESRLLLEWPKIVGEELARNTVPQKFVFDRHGKEGAKLHIICDPSWATELQYFEPVMIEKIATYFGYRAVERIVIKQHPIPRESQPKTVKVQQRPIDATTQAQLDTIEDTELREALSRLAASRIPTSGSGKT